MSCGLTVLEIESESMSRRRRRNILSVTVGRGPTGVRFVSTDTTVFEIHDHPLGTERTLSTVLRALLIARRLRSYDVVMTSEYFASFAISLRLILTFCRSKHVTIGLNQSRRLLKSGVRILDWVIDRVFRRCDMFFVHSRQEIRLFEALHDLPPGKFCFLPWGFDLPAIAQDRFAAWDRAYLCMIGRNNRDVESFIRLADGLAIDAILITSHYQNVPTNLPPNVHIFRDLSMEDCLSCIKHARINLILVKNDLRGAGHITAVAAMMLVVPQVVSDASVLSDYFVDQSNCIKVPLGDLMSIRLAVDKILNEEMFAAALVRNGVSYASKWLTHRATEARTYEMIESLLTGLTLQAVDPRWQRDFDELAQHKASSQKISQDRIS